MLEQYAARFESLKVDGQMLIDLVDNEADLINDFQIKIRVHRSKLLRELKRLALDDSENRQIQRAHKQRARTPHARHLRSTEAGSRVDPASPRIQRSRSLSTNFISHRATNTLVSDSERHARRHSLTRPAVGSTLHVRTPLESPSHEHPRRPPGRSFFFGTQSRFHRSDSASSQMSSRSSTHMATSSLRGGHSCFSEHSSPSVGAQSFMRIARISRIEGAATEQHLVTSAQTLIAMSVSEFLHTVLEAMTNTSPRAARAEQLVALESMVSECVQSLCNEGYFCVDDLLQDLDEPDFKEDLRKYGMKKRYLNELCGTLYELREVLGIWQQSQANASSPELNQEPPTEDCEPRELHNEQTEKLLATLSSLESQSDREEDLQSSVERDNVRQAQAAAHALLVSSDKSHDLRLRRNHTDTILPEIKQKQTRAELRPGGKVRLRRRCSSLVTSNSQQAKTKSTIGAKKQPCDKECDSNENKTNSSRDTAEGVSVKTSKARSRNGLNVDIQAIELEQDIQKSYNFGEDGLQYGDLLIGKSGVVGAPGIDLLREEDREDTERRADLGKMQSEIEIVEQVGKGSGGVVYRGVHLPTERSVAVKQVVVNDNSQRRQMRRELDTLLYGLDHPNIVRFYDSFSNPSDGTISMVFEFMDAGSLQDIVDCEHPVPAKILQKIALHCLRGLNYLHSLKYMHRDIKPSNLLISHTGDVKIADFGIAKEMGNTQAMASTYLGTFMYMSPERVRGGEYSFDSDIWSLGLSLFTCALGRYPFHVSNGYWGLAQAIREKPFPRLPQDVAQHELRKVIISCVDRVPENRPTTKALLGLSLFCEADEIEEDVLPLSNASRQELKESKEALPSPVNIET